MARVIAQNTATAGSGYAYWSSTRRSAQYFVVPAGYTRLAYINVNIKRAGTPGTIYWSWWTNSGGKPGTQLAETGNAESSIGTSYSWYTQDITDVTVSPSTGYWFVMRQPTATATTTDAYMWDSAGSGSGGRYSTDSGSTWNALGGGDWAYQVYGYGPPSSMGATTTSSVTTTSFYASSSVGDDMGDTISERGFCYSSTNGSPTISDSKAIVGSGTGSFATTIGSLSPNTDYYIRSYATNTAGTSYGAVKVQLTSTAIPTVTTSACSSVGTTSATGNGNITNTGGANSTRRGFCYMAGTTGTPTTSNSVVYDDGNFGTGAFQKAITGLSVGSDYRVRAYSVNSAGTGYGTTVQLTTYGIEADSERSVYISGTETNYESRGIYIKGGLPDDSESNLYIWGSIGLYSARGLWIDMIATNSSNRGLYIDGTLEGSKLYRNLRLGLDNSALRNRVYVRGGTYLSDTVTVKQVADGQQTVFYLPEKPHEITVEEGATSKTVGIKNINDFTEFDYLLNYQEKYVETDTAPTASTVMTFTFKYDIPVLVAVEDRDSIDAYGQFEYIIFDKTIDTIDQARERAVAELSDYADSIISGSFETEIAGFKAGQFIVINLPDISINDERFVVKSVVATSVGGGNFTYHITIVSAEMLGILKFLINLLESDKNALDIDPNEVVDEISTITGASFTITAGTPTLTTRSGAYQFDSGADWNISEWWT